MNKIAIVLAVALLSGAAAAQAASYTYIDQKGRYKNPGPKSSPPGPWLTALNLPKIGTTFKLRVPGSDACIPCDFWVVGTGLTNPNLEVRLYRGFLYTSAEVHKWTNPGAAFVEMRFFVPNNAALIGVRFYQQVVGVFGSSQTGSSYQLSRGGAGVIGK
jgi:hypothetical protein